MQKTAVLNVVGLTPRLIGEHTPRLRAFAERGTVSAIGSVLPAVTCSVQSTYLTGKLPAEHGVVGNGWYYRDECEVHLWRQSNPLVQGPKIWDVARQLSKVLWATQLSGSPPPVKVSRPSARVALTGLAFGNAGSTETVSSPPPSSIATESKLAVEHLIVFESIRVQPLGGVPVKKPTIVTWLASALVEKESFSSLESPLIPSWALPALSGEMVTVWEADALAGASRQSTSVSIPRCRSSTCPTSTTACSATGRKRRRSRSIWARSTRSPAT